MKTGSGLLASGWLLLAIGACRADLADPAHSPDNWQRWEDASRVREVYQWKWQSIQSARIRSLAPLRIAGAAAASIPAAIEVERISVAGPPEGEGALLTVKGNYDPAGFVAGFREWVESLESGRLISRVENLQFQRDQGRVTFELVGRVEGETARL
jgi:hypothetical protein